VEGALRRGEVLLVLCDPEVYALPVVPAAGGGRADHHGVLLGAVGAAAAALLLRGGDGHPLLNPDLQRCWLALQTNTVKLYEKKTFFPQTRKNPPSNYTEHTRKEFRGSK
jgi:hypothetical protein